MYFASAAVYSRIIFFCCRPPILAFLLSWQSIYFCGIPSMDLLNISSSPSAATIYKLLSIPSVTSVSLFTAIIYACYSISAAIVYTNVSLSIHCLLPLRVVFLPLHASIPACFASAALFLLFISLPLQSFTLAFLYPVLPSYACVSPAMAIFCNSIFCFHFSPLAYPIV